jgi:hypothetical protein
VSDQPIDLIRRMPHLYYAAELAARAPHDQMPTGYAEAVLGRAGELYDALTRCILDSELTKGQRAQAVDALKMLRAAPRERARLDLAAKVFNSIPADESTVGKQGRELLQANFAEARERINAEASATNDLMRLLHTLVA